MKWNEGIDAFLFDIGGTLVAEAPPNRPVAELNPEVRPGVVELLRRLAEHHRIGAVTNTSTMRELDVRKLLEPVGLNELLEVLVTSVDVGAAKPDCTGRPSARHFGKPPSRTATRSWRKARKVHQTRAALTTPRVS